MGESVIALPPDSTGKKLRTRQRVIGANTIEEQYMILQNERVVSARGYATTWRTPARASAAHPIFSVWNGHASAKVSIRRLTIEVDSIAASAVASPYARLFRTTAAPTNGTVLTPIQQDTSETIDALIVVRQDASADNTSSASALTVSSLSATPLWTQLIPRWQTLAGYQALTPLNLLPDDSVLNGEDPVVLQPSQGVVVRVDAAAALAAGAFTYHVKAVIGQFTLP